MSKYAVIYEAPTHAEGNWSSYAPDLPGCVSVGDTREECESNMAEAVEGHLDALRRRGYPVPRPSSYAGMLEVAA